MKLISKKLNIIILVMLLLISISSITLSYTYWANHLNSSSISSAKSFNVGNWQMHHPVYNPIGETNPYIDETSPGENLTNPPINIPTFNTSAYYSEGDIVYANGQLYEVLTDYPWGQPGTSAWHPYLNPTRFIYNSSNQYLINDVVVYQGAFYTNVNNGQSINSYAWNLYADGFKYLPNKVYTNDNVGKIIKHDENYYKIVNYTGTKSPLVSMVYSGEDWDYYRYRRLSPINQDEINYPSLYGMQILPYDENKTYGLNEYAYLDFGSYKELYQVVNVSRANSNYPGTSYNSWNRVDTTSYKWFNVYNENSYVSMEFNINNQEIVAYFKAVSGGSYNENEPGFQINSWNRVDTFYYKDINVYKTDDIVLHNNIVYRATTNIYIKVVPGSSPGWNNYWEIV